MQVAPRIWRRGRDACAKRSPFGPLPVVATFCVAATLLLVEYGSVLIDPPHLAPNMLFYHINLSASSRQPVLKQRSIREFSLTKFLSDMFQRRPMAPQVEYGGDPRLRRTTCRLGLTQALGMPCADTDCTSPHLTTVRQRTQFDTSAFGYHFHEVAVVCVGRRSNRPVVDQRGGAVARSGPPNSLASGKDIVASTRLLSEK